MNQEHQPFAGETIGYGYRTTEIGLAAIGVSGCGVAAVLLGSDRNDLRSKLTDALPGARLPEDGSMNATLDEVARHLCDPAAGHGLALDLRGNASELAVWAALRAIPAGETRSYGALAKEIGTGITAQEVGAACAANRLAVVVPCHRVLKADGSISGYRWGVHRKRRLLALEKAA